MSNELVRGSFILLVTIGIYNLLNFIFHFSMGRLLGPAGYGVLAVLMSIIYIYGVPSEAIQNVVSKYTSRLNFKKENRKIKSLMKKSIKKGLWVSLCLFVILIISSFFLADFLNINIWLLLLTNTLIFASFLLPVVRGVLQGRKKFGLLGSSMIIESVLKIFFAITLVFLGYGVFGAVGGVIIGLFSALIFTLFFNKDILNKKEEEVHFEGIYLASVSYFVAMLVILLIFSMDIILAKRFFSPELAGQYSVLSMMGKMIYFGTIAISKAMFPLTSEKHEKNEDSHKLFKRAVLLVTFLCIIAVLIYYFIPEFIINILYGEQYISMAPYLVYSGIALSFLALTNLILIYGLSAKGIKNYFWLFGFVAVEIILLIIFHNNLLEYTLAFMVSNIIIFIGSFFFLKR